MLVIFDLDGTLADINHRLHHIQKKPKDWPAFFRGCRDDLPKRPIIQLNHALDLAGWHIVICSGRSEDVRRETEVWLTKHNVRYRELLMRLAGDFRDDTIVKKEMLHALRLAGKEPLITIDDRQRVVDMWREESITCLQCDQWDETPQPEGSKEG